MTECSHEVWKQNAAISGDGLCPLCLADEIERINAENAHLRAEITRLTTYRDGLAVTVTELTEQNERLTTALDLFVNFCTYRVAREINPRGYAWRPEKDLDYARGEAQKALGSDAEQPLQK